MNKGEVKRGRVKRTKGQKKKHISQMTGEEVAYLKKQIKLVPTWKSKKSTHVEKKRISFDILEVVDTLLSQNVQELIVEYNLTVNKETGEKDRRVLIRSTTPQRVKIKEKKKRFFAMAHLCFVISLDTYQIVTAYWNKVTDEHETMNWKRYNEKLQVIQ